MYLLDSICQNSAHMHSLYVCQCCNSYDNFRSQTNLPPRPTSNVEQAIELPHEGVLVAEELSITPTLYLALVLKVVLTLVALLIVAKRERHQRLQADMLIQLHK